MHLRKSTTDDKLKKELWAIALDPEAEGELIPYIKNNQITKKILFSSAPDAKDNDKYKNMVMILISTKKWSDLELLVKEGLVISEMLISSAPDGPTKNMTVLWDVNQNDYEMMLLKLIDMRLITAHLLLLRPNSPSSSDGCLPWIFAMNKIDILASLMNSFWKPLDKISLEAYKVRPMLASLVKPENITPLNSQLFVFLMHHIGQQRYHMSYEEKDISECYNNLSRDQMSLGLVCYPQPNLLSTSILQNIFSYIHSHKIINPVETKELPLDSQESNISVLSSSSSSISEEKSTFPQDQETPVGREQKIADYSSSSPNEEKRTSAKEQKIPDFWEDEIADCSFSPSTSEDKSAYTQQQEIPDYWEHKIADCSSSSSTSEEERASDQEQKTADCSSSSSTNEEKPTALNEGVREVSHEFGIIDSFMLEGEGIAREDRLNLLKQSIMRMYTTARGGAMDSRAEVRMNSNLDAVFDSNDLLMTKVNRLFPSNDKNKINRQLFISRLNKKIQEKIARDQEEKLSPSSMTVISAPDIRMMIYEVFKTLPFYHASSSSSHLFSAQNSLPAAAAAAAPCNSAVILMRARLGMKIN